MKRRIRFLVDGTNVQENEALLLADRFQRAGWSASIAYPDTRPLVERPSVDVLWVVDPAQAKQIGDGRFRLLVWHRDGRRESKPAQAGALILDNCADAVWTGGALVLEHRDCYVELDRQVKRELFEEVCDALGLPVMVTTKMK